MQLEEKRNKVLDFFEVFIDNFIINDLKILHSIHPDKDTGLGGCTIPTAMTIISSTELIGFLLNEKGKTGDSKLNISHFLTYKENLFFPYYYNSDTIEIIYNYRHGMMHHFFPKFKGGFAGIHKAQNDVHLLTPTFINGKNEISLNVTVLAIDFLNAIEKLKLFLLSTTDEKIFDTMLKGLKNLDYYLENSIYTTTTINPGTPKNK